MSRRDWRRAALLLVSLAVLTPVAFYSKRGYHGPAAAWVHDSLGGLFYEIFWCLVIALVRPRWSPARVALTVLSATCALEFLQLWHPAPLACPRRWNGCVVLSAAARSSAAISIGRTSRTTSPVARSDGCGCALYHRRAQAL